MGIGPADRHFLQRHAAGRVWRGIPPTHAHRVQDAETRLSPLFRLRQPERIGLPQQEIGGEAGEVVMLMVWAVGDVTRRRRVTHEIGADGSVVTILDRERRSVQSSDRRRERRRSPAMP